MKNIILILSQRNDPSTDDVMFWISHYGHNKRVIRLSEQDLVQVRSLNIHNEFTFELSVHFKDGTQENIRSQDIFSYWYRRGFYTFRSNFHAPENEFEKNFISALFDFSTGEAKLVKDLLDHSLATDHPSINRFQDIFTSKLHNLKAAAACGIKVPDTLLTSNGEALKAFYDKKDRVICKPFKEYDASFVHEKDRVRFGYAPQLISHEDVAAYFAKENFHLTMFQEYIPKRFEVRSFFLHGKFYSMAIFSQANEKTKIDFRNYDYSRPNRNVPFQLPVALERSLGLLMKTLNLNSGSMDIVYTDKGDYVFLEVNPVGQFQWLSHNCNYYIEKDIATHLSYGIQNS